MLVCWLGAGAGLAGGMPESRSGGVCRAAGRGRRRPGSSRST